MHCLKKIFNKQPLINIDFYDNEIKTGYFSSDRKGGKGGFDIYRFTPFRLRIIVNVIDSTTSKPIDYAITQLTENEKRYSSGKL